MLLLLFLNCRSPEENAKLLLTYSSDEITDTTQMPVLPFSLRAMYDATKDASLVKEFLYPMINYFKWWRATRDDGDGVSVGRDISSNCI